MSNIFLFALLAQLSILSAVPVDPTPLRVLPLRKMPTVRHNEHPAMAFQRHQNAAVKRLHRFTGSQVPPQAVFDAKMVARKLQVDEILLEKPSGSNANGFSRVAAGAITESRLTDSSSTLVQGGLDYTIESNDIGYLIEVPIGNPPKTFLLLADTGSGDTWVPSSSCTACGNHTTLGSDVSSTFESSTTPFAVTYGSGNVSGHLCSDSMIIAGMKLDKHVFGVATKESRQFSGAEVPFDGLMGLSLSGLSRQRTLTPLDALVQTGQISSGVLGIALGRVTDGENNGELVFGQVDPTKFDPSTTQTLPVTQTRGFWQVSVAAVIVNGQIISSDRQAILDTGTSLIVAPSADAVALHRQIKGAKRLDSEMFSIPCTTNAKVSLAFGSATFQIDARDLLFQPLNNDLKGDCISTITAGTVVDAETWLLGDTFLKNVYMSTDSQSLSVTLSARSDVPGSSSFGRTDPAAAAKFFPGNSSGLPSAGLTEQQALANGTASRDGSGGKQLGNGSGRAHSLQFWLLLRKVLHPFLDTC